jgi:exo-beta-1,3-glucanase (GH17 family)
MRTLFVAFFLLTLLPGCSDSKAKPHAEVPFSAPAVAYQPRGYTPGSSALPSRTSEKQVREDLRLLKKSGFRSLVTYGADGVLGSIPQLARKEGFDGVVIMGIWDIFSKEEWINALAQIPYVDGYCLGNEGLGVRYSQEELAIRMKELRRVTGLPVTTSEPIDSYIEGPYRDWLLAFPDWPFPLAHPVWADELDPQEAVNWLLARQDYLVATSGRRVVIKEAGFPSSGLEGCNEDAQRLFFELLEASGLSFFYFEAFDQPWKKSTSKSHEIEAHWGLFDAQGMSKEVIPWLMTYWSKK